jgi:peptidoglycan/LPS O-acetylase OafA/YrhL
VNGYKKLAAQVLATVLAAVAAALAGDNHIDQSELVNIAILAFGAFAVAGAGDLPSGVWAHTKTYVAAATAALVFIQSALSDGGGITTAEWFQCAVAVLGVLGVASVAGPKVKAASVAGNGRPGY